MAQLKKVVTSNKSKITFKKREDPVKTATTTTKAETNVRVRVPAPSTTSTPDLQPALTPVAQAIPQPASQPISTPEPNGVFKNNFFSVAGQKERLGNVVDVLKIAINPLTKERIVANTPSKTVNTILEAGANHAYTTAGIAAAGITAVRYAPAALNAIKSPGTLSFGSAAPGLSKGLLAAGALGVGAGLLFGGSGGLKAAPQNSTQTQQPTINNDNRQFNNQNNSQDNRQYNTQTTNYIIKNSPGAGIQGDPLQSPSSSPSFSPSQSPVQSVPSELSAGQSASQAQSNSGTNWGMIALVGAAAYFLLRGE